MCNLKHFHRYKNIIKLVIVYHKQKVAIRLSVEKASDLAYYASKYFNMQ